ncbi:hypothetical protein Zmor_019719 [Zophobas morio]|uniref:Odorant receptor n=1 Tax=Zophobas morio TaxID=2755281 RepID=A0AA38I2B7_9CUCU|nr:hypothetical protein Zmor_019719 [Zophobas morio]
MLTTPILEGDSLLLLMHFPRILSANKFIQIIGYFYYIFLTVTIFGDFLVILLNKEWNLFLSQYLTFFGGMPLIIACYVTRYHRSYHKMFWNIYYDIFPLLWPLRTLGIEEFNKFRKVAKLATFTSKIVIIMVLITSTGGLPWYGDEYEVILPVKIAMDYFDGWLLKLFLITFFSSFYHMGLTIISNVFSLTYLMLHLYNQLRMLNVRLKNLSTGPNLKHAFEDAEFQEFVNTELISCIKLHQRLLRFTEAVNNLLYYPIFYYTAGGILIGLAIIVAPKTSLSAVRFGFVALIAMCLTVVICVLGQLLENESEKSFICGYSTAWYLWNTDNRRLLCLFLLKTQEKLVLSSSGIITINYKLLIDLYHAIYSTLMFLLSVSEIL